MSKVTQIEFGIQNTKYRELMKLLLDTSSWELQNKGGYLEKFTHISGWYFYTGLNIVAFNYKGGYKVESNPFVHMWNAMTNKEDRFISRWLENKADE